METINLSKTTPQLVPYNGIYRDLSFEDYRTAPGLSRSKLLTFAKSVEHYEHAIETQTASMSDGIALHYAILEPEKFNLLCIPGPTKTKGVKWMKMQEDNPHLIIMDPDTYDNVSKIKEAFWDDPVASKLLVNGESEVSFFWNDTFTNIPLKCRPDYWREDKKCLIDLKFVDREGSLEERFLKSLQYYQYHVQAAMYLNGVSACTEDIYETFVFIVVEKQEPFNIQVYYLDKDFLQIGHNLFTLSVSEYYNYQLNPSKYKLTKKKIKKLSPPKWLVNRWMEGEL